MQTSLKLVIGGVAAALFSLSTYAQPGPGMGGMTGMSGMKAASPECARARDPQRCEALQKAKEICKDKAAPDKRKCMSDAMPPMDCSKSRSPARCEAHQKAKEACKDKAGVDYRQCLREQKQRGKAGGKAAPKN